ncbi:uncharacterized protein LOC128396481 [Panonychus citri]|uniref:uncharacterized protein LOC128396481 n=1 Tax=Panonychus citri TaxID=50023 RepID=UPI002307BEA0|nr:uncharacterized protein LOC128396481 [Panonychus citri]
MFNKSLIALCFVLGCTLIGSSAVEDIEFLTTISTKYSPTLVKQLLVSRLDHKLKEINELNSTVGINQEQQFLCSVIFRAVDTLRSDVISMDEQQVICGDETYTKNIKSFISQFSLLITILDTEFEALKTPNIGAKSPEDLIRELTSTVTDISTVVSGKAVTSLNAYITEIKKIVDNEKTSSEIKVLGHAILQELNNMITTINSWKTQSPSSPKATLLDLLARFEEAIDIFYRQIELSK